MARYKIRKYLGDDQYSWALFKDGRPIMTGMDRTEAQWRLRTKKEEETNANRN